MKILIISDTHLSINSEPGDERWFPPQVARMSSLKAREFLAEWDKRVEAAYNELLTRTQEFAPYDLIVSLGDNTTGDNERGMLTKKARWQWNIFRQKLENSFPFTPKKFVWGGHDVGFLHRPVKGFPWFGLKKDVGMTEESFEIAQKLLGPPWQAIGLEGFTFLLLNSEVIRTSREPPNPEIQGFASELAEKQIQFIHQSLAKADKAILAIHDPRQLPYLRDVLTSYLQEQKIVLTLTGHFHLPLIGRIYALKPGIRGLNLKIIPSPLGLMFFRNVYGKGGFCTLELFDQDKYKLNYHWL